MRDLIMFTLPRDCNELDGNVFWALSNIPFITRRIIAILVLYIRNNDDVDNDVTADALLESALKIIDEHASRNVFPRTDHNLEDLSNCYGHFSIEELPHFTPEEEHIFNMLRDASNNTRILICVIKALALTYDLDVLDVDILTSAAERVNEVMDRWAEPDDPDIEEKIAKLEAEFEPEIDEIELEGLVSVLVEQFERILAIE